MAFQCRLNLNPNFKWKWFICICISLEYLTCNGTSNANNGLEIHNLTFLWLIFEWNITGITLQMKPCYDYEWSLQPMFICGQWIQFCSTQMPFVNENYFILIQIWQNYVSKGPSDYELALIQVLAWHQTSNTSLPEPMLTQSTDAHVCTFNSKWA